MTDTRQPDLKRLGVPAELHDIADSIQAAGLLGATTIDAIREGSTPDTTELESAAKLIRELTVDAVKQLESIAALIEGID